MFNNHFLMNRHPVILLAILVLTFLTGCVSGDGDSAAGTGSVSSGSSAGTNTGSGSAQTTGSFSLSWTAPVTRSDGSPISLAEIDGYRVYYGDSPGSYTGSVNINDGAATSATITDVPVGDYYVVMTTYDSSGLESSYSGMLSKQAL